MDWEPRGPLAAFILSIGDELLTGVTVDTNSARIAQSLVSAGAVVVGHATVGDDQRSIEGAIRESLKRSELLVLTGGIGPTPDDLTREALAEVMDVVLVERREWVAHLEQMYRQRRRAMPAGNRKQALVPRGTELLWNPTGTAAGIAADLKTGLRSGVGLPEIVCRLFVLPGVPKEMQAMLEQHVVPWVRAQAARRGGRAMRTRALHTLGLGESDVAARLGDLLRRRDQDEGLQVGTTAAHGIVSIRIYAGGRDEAEATAKLDAVERAARAALGAIIFGRDQETLPEVVGRLLREDPRRPVLSPAESCTGGWVAKLVTDVAGASDYFHRGYVTYSNKAKTALLGVPGGLIEAHGAVSEPVVVAMARGALRELEQGRPGLAIAISGVAGPAGGTAQKPVGTVCIGLAGTEGLAFARTFRFGGDREDIRRRSAYMALALLRFHLLGHDPGALLT